mmetsp:Transcript_35504/g.41414  ORF Transcript_35504/g.41414 Transcript_35504/m.41414 type:complete len:317 (+) Transcript_35504:275-1225(+)
MTRARASGNSARYCLTMAEFVFPSPAFTEISTSNRDPLCVNLMRGTFVFRINCGNAVVHNPLFPISRASAVSASSTETWLGTSRIDMSMSLNGNSRWVVRLPYTHGLHSGHKRFAIFVISNSIMRRSETSAWEGLRKSTTSKISSCKATSALVSQYPPHCRNLSTLHNGTQRSILASWRNTDEEEDPATVTTACRFSVFIAERAASFSDFCAGRKLKKSPSSKALTAARTSPAVDVTTGLVSSGVFSDCFPDDVGCVDFVEFERANRRCFNFPATSSLIGFASAASGGSSHSEKSLDAVRSLSKRLKLLDAPEGDG